MLPSTGYFKGINCPFYDNGLCDRPYCHFRHVKKESQHVVNDSIESEAILQKLVSAAVHKVLQQTDTTGTISETRADSINNDFTQSNEQNAPKATYNPTPIAELKKIITESENKEDVNEQRRRHIPVPYTPRKPASLPIKRPIETNGSSKPYVFIPPPVKYTPGGTDTVQLDPYTPKGAPEVDGKYLPGSTAEIQEYEPNESQKLKSKNNYVPSDKSVSKKKILEYKPIKLSAAAESSTVTYQPTPRSLAPCFSSDEEEPDNKKRKLSTDLNGLDELGAEFDILDQILDEEKSVKASDIYEDSKKCQEDTETNSKSKPDMETSISNKIDKEHKKEKHSKSRDKSKGASEHKHKEISAVKNENSKDKARIKDEAKHKNKDDLKDKEKARLDSKIKSKHKDDSKKKDKHKDVSKVSGRHKEDIKGHNREKSKVEKKTLSSKKSSKEKDRSKNSSYDEKKEKHSKEKTKHSSRDRSKSKSSKSSDRESKSSDKPNTDSKSRDKSNHHRTHKSSRESKSKEHKKRKEKESVSLSDNDNGHEENVESNNDELYESSESDEESRALECKRIFEEYVPAEINVNQNETIENTLNNIEEEYVPSKKRVSRTLEKYIKIIPKAPVKPDFKVNAAQAMAERLTKVKEYHASKMKVDTTNEILNKIDLMKNAKSAPSATSTKIRIAHVPYASTMMTAKKTISPNVTAIGTVPSTSATISQTVKKGVQRVAHLPNEKFIDRPGVLEPLGSKIAANIRSTYLNMMIDECLKIYLVATDAYARAQHEELTTSKKCSTVQIYKNSAVLTVSRLRKEFQECKGVKKSGSECVALQKVPNALTGSTGYAGSWSFENKSRRGFDTSHEFTGIKFYQNIQKWILTDEQLKENGFPKLHPNGDKGRAIIYGQKKQNPPKGFIRTCGRCKKDYTVNKLGFASLKEECIYHPNNKYRVRGEARYQCCGQDGTSDGCCVAPSHVYEYVDYENLKGYVRTMDKETDYYGIYSLDCEMCYTTNGLDLTRVTVINTDCKVVYETLVKPFHPIIDYNTRYSGITEEQMEGVKTTLLDVQATLLTMFNSKTILIGHSLESDFKALKLIHDTVIDTSVVFPHKMGPPYKRALRNLSSEYLKKIIQNSIDGHDSAEDATVCMELIVFKLKEYLKTR